MEDIRYFVSVYSLKTLICFDQKFLLWNMVSRTLKLRYRRSALGYLWTLLVPLSTAAMYYFLFKIIFKIQDPDFAAYVTTGILIWTYFQGTLIEGMDSLLGNLPLLLQVNIPLNIFPLTTAIANFFTLILSVPVILLVAYATGIELKPSSILVLYYLGLLGIQAYCLSYILSITVIYIRDLKQVMALVLQMLMYATPILYQMNQIPEKYVWILFVNPVGKIFTGVHNCLLRGLWPTWVEIF